jgi:hypothetical protein
MGNARKRQKNLYTWAQEKFFGTFDRGIASTSWFMGFISILISAFFIKYPSNVPRFIIVRDLLFLFGFFLVTLVIYGRYMRRERVFKNQRAYLTKVIERTHKITSKYHNDLFDNFRELAEETHSDVSLLSKEDINRYQRMCEYVADNVRDSLLSYFQSLSIDLNGDLSVSIKLIVDSDSLSELLGRNPTKRSRLRSQNKWILTFARDRDTTNNTNREVCQYLYSINGNSSYQYLTNSSRPYYCSDNLLAQDGYLNESERWEEFYNATIVVPIRYMSSSSSSSSFVSYGFLAVDAPNPGGRFLFTDKSSKVHVECLAILQHAADLLATHSLILRIQALATLNRS